MQRDVNLEIFCEKKSAELSICNASPLRPAEPYRCHDFRSSYINLWFLCVLFAFSSVCFAEKEVKSAAHNESRDVLESELRSLMPKNCVFSSYFVQIKKTAQFRLDSSGALFYNCDHGLIWQSKSPFSEALIYKKNSLNFRVAEDGKREELTSMSHRSLSKFLLHLLDANINYFFDTFDVSYGVVLASDSFRQKKSSNNLFLRPKSKHMLKAISSISMYRLSALGPDSSSAYNSDVPNSGGGLQENFSFKGNVNSDLERRKIDIRLLTRIRHADGGVTDIVLEHIDKLVPEPEGTSDLMCLRVVGEQFDVCETLKLKKKAQNIK